METFMIMYEVVGYPISCPVEKFDVGIYMTRDRAEKVVERCHEDYSNCEFDIEEKWVEE
jgi:hypothetical protein